MIRILLVALGLGDLAGFVHYLAHHRTGISTALVGAAGWVGHRAYRRFKNPGQRVVGMPPLKPLAERRAAA